MQLTEADYKRGLKLDQTPLEIIVFSDYFAGAARVMQEGVAVHSLLLGCGWKTHDVNPNEVWKYGNKK